MTAETNTKPKPKIKESQRPKPVVETTTAEFGYHSTGRSAVGSGSPALPPKPKSQLDPATAVFADAVMRQMVRGEAVGIPAERSARGLRQSAVMQMQQWQGNAVVQRFLAQQQATVIQRCGGKVHAGCTCANCSDGEETELDGTVPNIQRQVKPDTEQEAPRGNETAASEQNETAVESESESAVEGKTSEAIENSQEKETESPAKSAGERPVAAKVPASAAQPTPPPDTGNNGVGTAKVAGGPAPGLPGATTPLTNLVSAEPPPDSTDRILEMARQAREGGGEPGGLVLESPEAGNILQDCRIPPTPAESGEPMSLDPLYYQVEVERERLLQAATINRDRVMADAQAQQMALLAAIEAETTRLHTTYSTAREQVQTASDGARMELETNRAAQIEAINAAADNQQANLPAMVAQKKIELQQSAEEKAVAAETFGETQAQNVISECSIKAAAAHQLGEDKVAQYSGYDEAAEIANAARRMAGEVANSITQAGQDMANTARQDMAKLSKKFRQEAAQSTANFDNPLNDALSEIERERSEAIRTINQVTDNTLTQLDATTSQILAQIESNEQAALVKLSEVGRMALPEYDQLAEAACTRIDQDTAVAIAEIESFAFGEAAPQLSQAQGPAAEAAQANACTQITVNVDDFINQMDTAVANIQQSFQQHTLEVHGDVTAYVDGLIERLGGVTSAYETELQNTVARVQEDTQNTTNKSVENMEKVGTDLEAEIQKTIDQHNSQWDKELTEGQAALTQKMNDGLAEQDRALIDLAAAIDQKAEEIENAGLLDAIGSLMSGLGGFISGLVGGLLGALGEVLGAIFEAVWEIITDLVVLLVDLVGKLLGLLWDLLVGIVTFILGLIIWIFGALGWLILQIVNLLLSIVNWIADLFGGWPWLRNLLNSLHERLATIGSFLLDPLTGDFAGCEDEQQEKLERGAAQAVLLGNSALAKLSVSPLDPATKTQFKRFFMSEQPEHVAEARSILGETLAGLQSNPTDMKCEPPGSIQCTGANAYTHDLLPFVSLHFCADFINSASEREIALVVLHEATHRYAGTDDHAYFGAVFSLSTEDALDNADTYEQFVDAVA